MGRPKKNKPHRKPGLTLRGLNPPGRWYETWNRTPSLFTQQDPEAALASLAVLGMPEPAPGVAASLRHLAAAAQYYPLNEVPNAALVIEQHIERGVIPLRTGPGREGVEHHSLSDMAGRLPKAGIDFAGDPARADVDLDDATAAAEVGVSDRQAAAALHLAHASGTMLIADSVMAEFRLVAARPCDKAGGGRWVFFDEMTPEQHAEAQVLREADKAVAAAQKGMGL